MRALSLYLLTRLPDKEMLSYYEKALSQREEGIRVRQEEVAGVKGLCMNLLFHRASLELLDNWFYSFTIPQIGKEFDLLKIDESGVVVNLELKSQEVSLEKIEHQLKQNQYYLSHIGEKIYSFVYVSGRKNPLLKYSEGEIKESSFEEVIEKIKEINNPINKNIEELFKPNEFLISPINAPQKFIDRQYYLSLQQENIKKEIGLKERGLWGITGSAGTGKTLLLYDIAKMFSARKKVCIIHGGVLSEGHKYIDSHLDNVTVISPKTVSREELRKYTVVCVDESQRIYPRELKQIINLFDEEELEICVFTYDFAQVLSKKEKKSNNPKYLKSIVGFKEYQLTEKIRTNKEVFSFVRTMMQLSDKPSHYVSYENVDVVYANDVKEADRISTEYMRKGYVFITYTPSRYVYNIIDHYAENINSHQVIGQEFDKVVVVLDNNFEYDEEGVLRGREHPNLDYLFDRLVYQNISRAREQLCLIVLNSLELFKELLCIKEHVRE